MSVFQSHLAFHQFEREVTRSRRFIRSGKADDFLRAVRNTCETRIINMSAGRVFWRAQVGHDWRHIDEIKDKIPAAHPPKRMLPLNDRAMEGRANAKGIPVLYLCSNKEAAMSEVRPWIGSMISVGRFVVKRPLKIVSCTSKQQFSLVDRIEGRLSAEDVDAYVWSTIDHAFTKPVMRSDDTGDYVATQILTELFRDMEFDGIAYRSAFGERSTNFAFFDLKAAEMKTCELHEVTSAKLNFRERDAPYWVTATKKKKTTKPRGI